MRKVIIAIVSALCLALALFVFVSHARQDKPNRPSPPASASVDLGGGKSVTIDYSSPRLKGRKFGKDLAPYGEVWRTGANEATTLSLLPISPLVAHPFPRAITPSSRFRTRTSGL